MGVKGKSMEPETSKKDTVIVNKMDKALKNYKILAVNNSCKAVLNPMARNMGQQWLVSDNLDQPISHGKSAQATHAK